MLDSGVDPALRQLMAVDGAGEVELETVTDGAALNGVFGSPTYFVGREMFFGNDRVDFVLEALEATA